MKIICRCLLIILIFSIYSCKHDDIDEAFGPKICPGSDFLYSQSLTLSADEIQFSTDGSIEINAAFSEEAAYNLQIVGQSSGAIKTFEGTSSGLSHSWYGRADSGSVFFSEETCKVTLSIECLEDQAVTKTITVSTNDFLALGYLLSDFDGGGTIKSWYDFSFQSTIDQVGIVDEPLTPVQGDNYWVLSATKATPDFYFGGFGNNDKIDLSAFSTDAKDVYLNMFVNVNGYQTAGSMSFVFGSNPNINHTFSIDQITGWQYVSFPLSDVSSDFPVEDLEFIEYSVEAASEVDHAELAVDFIFFTEDGGFYDDAILP